MRPNPDPPARLVALAVVTTLLVAAAVAYVMLSPPTPQINRLAMHDKALHFLAFVVLVLPLSMVLTAQRLLAVLVLGAIAYGVAIEIMQPTVGRSAEIGDVLANSLGAITGASIGTLLRFWWSRRSARHMPAVRPRGR